MDRQPGNQDRERLKEVHATDLTESRVNEDFVDWLKTKGPTYLLAILVVATFGSGLGMVVVALGIIYVPAMARLVRSVTLVHSRLAYVDAARALGYSDRRIMLRHILPNLVAAVVVQSTIDLAYAILDIAALSFLGLGAQPPQAEWGSMLASERNQVFTAPHLVFFPGLAIMITVLGFNLMGDGLRDALDPTLHR